MRPILTLIGFAILLWTAKRVANVKRRDPIGFRPPKKTIWEKLFGK